MRYPLQIYFFIACLFGFSSMAICQNYNAEISYYNVEDGLSHREVNALFQDSRGFIWMGTKYGLNRFDGYEFKWWTKERDGLVSNNIREIEEDAEGFLWIFHSYDDLWSGGITDISLIHPEKAAVTTFKEKFGNPKGFNIQELTTSFTDNEGRIFWTTYDRPVLISYHPKDDFRVLKLEGIKKFELISVTSRQTIWISADTTRLLEIDYDGQILKEYQHAQDWIQAATFPEPTDVIYLSEKKKDGEVGKYFFIDQKGERLEFFPSRWVPGWKPNTTDELILVQNPVTNTIWGSSVIIIPEDKQLFDLNFLPNYYENFGARSMIFDNQGRRWLGGNFGVEVVDLTNSKFKKLLFNPEFDTDISIRGIVEKQGKIFVCPEADREDQSNSPIVLNIKTGKINTLWKDPYMNWGFREILLDNGTIWAANLNTLFKCDLQSGQHQKFTEATPNSVWSMYQLSDQLILYGCQHGLGLFSTETEAALPYTRYNDFKELAQAFVIDILPEKNGNLWLCTNIGLYLLNPKLGIQKRFWTGGKGDSFLPCNDIHHLHEDEQGIFWIATNGCGLIRWEGPMPSNSNATINNSKKNWHQFTRLDGLSNDIIYAVYEDGHQNLWMSSDFGIMQFDKQTSQVNTYLERDGITYHEFNRISHWKGEDGTIYFGGLNGITAFHPDDFYDESTVIQPELQITAFQQFDGKQNQLINRIGDIHTNNKIVLQPDDRFFLLEFVLLTYKDVDKIRYAWKIEGHDENWNHQKERSIRLSRLPYGTYQLKVKGQAANGQWSENELNIEMVVVKPFYLKNWFILLSLLGIIGAALGFYKWRTWQYKKTQKALEMEVKKQTAELREQAAELRQLDQLKSRFFANVSHELRTPLTLLLGPLNTVLKRNRLENRDFTLLKLMQKNGQNLLKLVGEILDLSKLESGKLQLNEAPLSLLPFLKKCVAQFESHAQHKGIQFIFQYQAHARLQILLDSEKFEKVINNLLSNAIKFTPAEGKISVMLKDRGDVISLKVEDTGTGIHPNDLPHVFNRFYQSKQPEAPTQGGTGIGLALCREYANLFEGEIYVESELDKGSTFVFEFPKKEVLGMADVTKDPEELKLQNDDFDFTIIPKNHSTPSPLTVNRQPSTILIVEDNPDLSFFIQQILSDQYQVITAENGVEALSVLSSRKPELIISDVMMPVMDGFQLLDKIKSEDGLRQIPVMMLTARADIQDKLKALRIGVDDYMLKPFVEEELLVRIDNLIRNVHERNLWLQKNGVISQTDDVSENAKNIPSITITTEDSQWLEELEAVALKNVGNFDLTAEFLSSELFTSRTQLFRRVKQLTGLTLTQYIREVRMQQARRLLETRSCTTVKAAAFAVGYKKVDSFSQNFKAHFGKLPSSYL